MPGEDRFWRNGGLKILFKKNPICHLDFMFYLQIPISFSALQFFLIVLISVSETTLYAKFLDRF